MQLYSEILMRFWASLVAHTVKNPPAVQETWVPSLGQEDPLEEGPATHSSILAWRIPGTEEPGGPQFMGSQRVGHNSATNTNARMQSWYRMMQQSPSFLLPIFSQNTHIHMHSPVSRSMDLFSETPEGGIHR